MKKSLVAIAALAVVGAASAQSSVSLTGVVGFGFQSYDYTALTARAAVAGTPSTFGLPARAASPAGTNRGLAMTDATIAVAVVEDLGGGLKGSAGITFDAASAAFGNALNRRNTNLQLAGGFGAVRFDQTRSGDLITKAMVAPSSLPEGMYDTGGVVSRGGIDMLSYITPSFGGFSGSLSYVESANNVSTLDSGGDGVFTPGLKTSVVTLNYANGPIAAGLAFKHGSGYVAGTLRSSNTEAFVTYDLGVAKVGFGYDGKLAGTSAANAVSDSNAFSLGVSVPVGAITLGANFAKRNVNKVTEFVAKYDLSKRTNVNLSLGRQTVDAAAAAGNSGNQYRLAVFHTF